MALHHRLSLWQKRLLGILCFPLLPFYLCVYCLCLKQDEAKTEQEESNRDVGHVEDARIGPRDKKIQVSFSNKVSPGLKQDKEKNKQEQGHVEEARRGPRDNKINLSFTNKGYVEEDEICYPKRKKQEDKLRSGFRYPWDRSSLKSLQIDLKAFEKLDAFASKVEANGSVDMLVRDLLRDARTDLEKTRVIWTWICHHIEYDIVGYQNKALRSTDPDDILRTRKGVCAGYSSLFERMCSMGGVQCKSVSGYSKGATYKLGQTMSGDPNHAWNMVYLERGWHLLDSTWGAGHLDKSTGTFKFQYNEFYFLTHPALFVEDHFPEQKEWQLLEPHLSMDQFERSVRHQSHFYSLGLLSSHPDTAVIETVKGKASIAIESRHHMLFTFHLNKTEEPGLMRLMERGMKLDVYPQRTGQQVLQIFAKTQDSLETIYNCVLDYRVDCKSVDTSMKIPKCLSSPVGPSWVSEKAGLLQPSHPDPVIHTVDGCCTVSFALDRELNITCNLKSDEQQTISNHVLQSLQRHKVEFKIRLPQAGAYVLLIFDDFTGFICNYLLTCSNPKVKWQPFPSRLYNPVGPNPESEKAGLLQPSHPDPVIHTEDGCCTVSFVVKQGLSLFSTLHSDETQMTSDMEQRHVFQTQQKNNVEFKVHLPKSGTYALCVYVKSKDSNNYTSKCNYLISCTNTTVKWSVFPLTYADWAKHYELVEPLHGVLPGNTEVLFKLKVPGVAGVSVRGQRSFPLTLSEEGYWEGMSSTTDSKEIYVAVNSKDKPNTWTYILRYEVGKEKQ